MTSVLWYSNETPDVGGQGGQRRQYFQIRSLVEAGHEVTVVSLDGDQDDSSVRALAPVRRLARPGRWARLGLPGRSGAAARALDVPCERVVVAHIESWQHLRARRLALPRPWLLDLHNVFSTWYAAQGRPDLSERWQRAELEAARSFDAVAVCSERDRAAFARSAQTSGRGAMLLPHGIEPDEWQPEPAPSAAPVVKLFGNWDWEPNRNGLVWFIEQVVPLVASTGIRVEVAGRGTDGLGGSDDGDVVRFVGRVDDLPTFLSDAWLVAMPVKVGVGAPVKFAEGLVTGVPLLATVDAADGQAWPGLLVSDDPDAWAARVAEVVADPGPLRETSRDRRTQVLRERSWDRTNEPLLSWVAQPSR